ncbi:MAG: polynucleotide adenylyltransferase PcnB [Treponemataceae bacterium]|nr:MAG: polynucleotide adenylyltransferase PcnB [Treponemataceae bacterium]
MRYRYALGPGGKLIKTAVVYTGNEHSIDPGKIDADARHIITVLRQHGFEAFLVGGAVRDLLLDKTPKDFDIVTDAPPPKIKRLFRNSRVIGKRFRLVHIFFGEKIFEVSTFRSLEDGTTGNTFGTIDDDVKRRDFTLNALYYDPIQEQVIDYVGGITDIAKRRIMPVIPLETIFTDDPVRMVRAIKYAAMTGFSMPPPLVRKIKKHAHLLKEISPSRITEELIKIINSGFAREIAETALKLKVYLYLQPAACSFILDDKEFKKAYFKSLSDMDSLTRACSAAPAQENPPLRFGEKLSYILFDFARRLTDWEQEIRKQTPWGELFTVVWAHCRNFILPMNPQRTELDYAVRHCIKRMGVKSKPSGGRRPVRYSSNSMSEESSSISTASSSSSSSNSSSPKSSLKSAKLPVSST